MPTPFVASSTTLKTMMQTASGEMYTIEITLRPDKLMPLIRKALYQSKNGKASDAYGGITVQARNYVPEQEAAADTDGG